MRRGAAALALFVLAAAATAAAQSRPVYVSFTPGSVKGARSCGFQFRPP